MSTAERDVLHMCGTRYGGPDEVHQDQYAGFMCPGCGYEHMIGVGAHAQGPRWGWNGSKVKPTFTPSILHRHDTLSDESRARNQAFHKEHGRYMTHAELPYDKAHVCHSFVNNGRIQFLNDCTHALAGQTVDLTAWTEEGEST